LGATTAKFKETITVTPGAYTLTATKTAFTYGGGVKYGFNNVFSVASEFVQYWNNVSVSADGLDKVSFYGVTLNVIYAF